MVDEQATPPKKIIIDEDWKSQVQAEKAAAAQAPETKKPAEAQALPPPDLIFLAGSIYLQSMVALGLLPDPLAEDKHKPVVQLDRAQHAIDTLQMLFDKTEGNRTSEETTTMDDMLYQLRMAYISIEEGGSIQKGGAGSTEQAKR
jgi:hypothetical protein